MASSYYKPCPELDRCDELIEKYWDTEQYDKCFAGHLELAEKGYPLAECQVGYFYYRGLGVEKDLAKALYWTPPSTATATGSTISPHFMKTAKALRRTWTRPNAGIFSPRSRSTVRRFPNAGS